MGGGMSWGKLLIISLGLMLLTHVAQARDIESFTDSQGILHITNPGAKRPGSPANPPGAQVPLPLRSGAGKVQVTLPARELVPQAQTADLKPEAPPAKPIPVAAQPRPPITLTADSEGLNRLPAGTGERGEPGRVTRASAHPLKPVSYSPPQPARPAPDGAIVVHRDHSGVIHISNVAREEEVPVAPVSPLPAVQRRGPLLAGAPPAVQLASYPGPALAQVQRQAPPPDAVFPALPEVSCPELGPEVAGYLRAKLLEHSGGLSGNTVHRHMDYRGVWQIVNDPAPEPRSPQVQLAASGEKITSPPVSPGGGAPTASGNAVGDGVGQAASRSLGPEGSGPARPTGCVAHF